MLEIRDMVCGYGGVTALRSISLEVKTGQLVALIGANGAGKSTTLRAISGLVAPRSGSLTFEGKDITGARPPRVLASGIAHCPEGRRVFPHMTVEENLDMGAYLRDDSAEISADRERIYAEFPRLADRKGQAAGTLSGGEQQMLAIGRALMSRPRLDDKLIVATTDAHIIALDMKTGKVIWDHETEDYKKGWRYTGGPLVASNVIVQGMTGCGNAMPGGCFITGHDINSGKELWRFHTVAQPGEPGGDSWNGLPLEKRFGASTWNSGSYDPETDTLFLGVGQPYPHVAEIGGLLPKKDGADNDALYTDSTLALDPHTGKLKWFYQHLKNDTWDLDYAYERVLVDIPVDGKVRKAMVTVGKLGIIEVLDRTNGQWLWSKQTVYQNVVSAIDPKTGAKTINQAAVPHIGQTTTNCPADPGSRGWPATAYSPRTHMLYIPLNEYCSDTTPVPIEEGKSYTGGSRAIFARRQIPDSDGNIGRMDGVDLFSQQAVWSDRTRAPQTGAALATGGGLVFAGALDRYFRAYDDKTGKVLWQMRASNIVNSFPITYSVKGRQYVAVAVGNGSSQARSLATLTPEIGTPDGGSALFVFALPEEK